MRPLERIRRQLDKCEITDITEIYTGNSLISEIDALGNSFNDMKQRIDELMDNLMRTQKKEYQMEVDARGGTAFSAGADPSTLPVQSVGKHSQPERAGRSRWSQRHDPGFGRFLPVFYLL